MPYDENSFLMGIAVGAAIRRRKLKGCIMFISSSPLSISVSSPGWDGTLEYSTDLLAWQTWNGSSISSVGGIIYLRGRGNTKIAGAIAARFRITGSGVRCIGNIENLLDHTAVSDSRHPVMGNYCFYRLFSECTALIQAPELPATSLSENCYGWMFYGCTSLLKAPELPAKKMKFSCYLGMFRGCSSLSEAPELPATELAEACYQYMFQGCVSLTAAPRLRATTVAATCYASMYESCTALETIPLLPAAALPGICYSRMFSGCSAIKLSETQTEEYATPYRVPPDGTGTAGTNATQYMFSDTGGTFTGTPTINTTYYTSNAVV